MKKFLTSLFSFAFICMAICVLACFCLPGDRAKNSMLGQQLWIEDMLKGSVGELRMVLVGGSGLGEGVVSAELSKAFDRRVVNAGLHGGLGLVYQMKAVAKYLTTNDWVVLVPEYANFNGESCMGDLELLALVVDVIPQDMELLDICQKMRLIKFMPEYAASKIAGLFKKTGSFKVRKDASGDADWEGGVADAVLPFPPARHMDAADFNGLVLPYINWFAEHCRRKGVRLTLLPAAFQGASYDNQMEYISSIEAHLAENGTPYAVSPKCFRVDDELCYGTPYHLNLKGRFFRTKKLIDVLSGGKQ